MVTIPLQLRYFCRKKKDIRSHEEYLSRIEKSLYYVNIPRAYCTSLPCTELAAEIFSEINKFSLDKLDVEEAANLSRNACVSPCSLVLALLYLERLKSVNPKYLTTVSPSELFLISVMVGSKFLQDDGEEDEVNNYEWAASAGVNVQDINKAEKEFLDAIKWKVFVSEKEFWERFRILECSLGFRQGCKRGWFTYTELHLLLGLIDIASLIQTFCTVTTACLTSYSASMLTLLGSALLVAQIPGLGLRPEGQKMNDNQDWNNLTSYNFTENFYMEPNIPHQFVISSELSLNSLTTLSNDLKTCENGDGFTDVRNINCEKLSHVDLFLKVSSLDLNDVSDPAVKDLASTSSVKVFQSCGSFWCWRGIKNHLFMNLGSNNLLPIMDYYSDQNIPLRNDMIRILFRSGWAAEVNRSE